MLLRRIRGSYTAGRQVGYAAAGFLSLNTLPQSRFGSAAGKTAGATSAGNSPFSGQRPPKKDLAITLHGLFGVSVLWSRIHTQLENEDFVVAHFRYPGAKPLPRLANELLRFAQHHMRRHGCTRVHFLAHSMGGLILRTALSHPQCPPELRSGCAVFITPASRGSRFGRRVGTQLPALQNLALMVAESLEPRIAGKLQLDERTGHYATHQEQVGALLQAAQDRIRASLASIAGAFGTGGGASSPAAGATAPAAEETKEAAEDAEPPVASQLRRDPAAAGEAAARVEAAAAAAVLRRLEAGAGGLPGDQGQEALGADHPAPGDPELWPLDAEYPQLDPAARDMSVANCIFQLTPRQLAAGHPLPASLHAVSVILGSLPGNPLSDGVIDARDTRLVVSPGTLLEQVKFTGGHSQILVMGAVLDYLGEFLGVHRKCLEYGLEHARPVSEAQLRQLVRSSAGDLGGGAGGPRAECKGIHPSPPPDAGGECAQHPASQDEQLMRLVAAMQDVEYLERLEDMDFRSDFFEQADSASGAAVARDPRRALRFDQDDDDDDGRSESGLFEQPPILFTTGWTQNKEGAVARRMVLVPPAPPAAQPAGPREFPSPASAAAAEAASAESPVDPAEETGEGRR